MKKTNCFLLVLVMLFTLASCRQPKGENSEIIKDDVATPDTDNGGNAPSPEYDHNAFTSSEERLFLDLFGEVIPFIPNMAYTVEEYSDPLDYVTIKGIVFTAYGNELIYTFTIDALTSEYATITFSVR